MQSLSDLIYSKRSAKSPLRQVSRRQQLPLRIAEGAIALLPFRGLADTGDFHRGNLVLGAVGGPVRVFRGDHVGAGEREVEGGVDHARLHALADACAQHGVAGAAGNANPVALLDAALFGIVGMDLKHIFAVPE